MVFLTVALQHTHTHTPGLIWPRQWERRQVSGTLALGALLATAAAPLGVLFLQMLGAHAGCLPGNSAPAHSVLPGQQRALASAAS